ncbi:hypothetical protein ACWDU9_08325 [Streptomyces cellulosae]
MRVVWQLLAVVVVSLVGGQSVAAVQDNPWATLGLGLVTAVLSVYAYAWVVGRTEKRPVAEVGRRRPAGRARTVPGRVPRPRRAAAGGGWPVSGSGSTSSAASSRRGPRPGGGFAVRARIPTGSRS